MKLWLLERQDYGGYDTYDACVVAASSLEEARDTHLEGSFWGDKKDSWFRWTNTWAERDKVTVTQIGEAMPGEVRRVVCASFNAG